MNVVLTPIRTGTVLLAPGYVYRGEARNVLEVLGHGVPKERKLICPLGAFLVEHPAEGPVLIDTGMRDIGRLGGVAGVRIGPGETLPEALAAREVELSDVRLVVMTHLHLDHTGWMHALPNATFAITRAEWSAARSRVGLQDGYVRAHLPGEERVRFVEYDAPEDVVDLLGDGSLRLFSTPGHTAGHQSLLVETAAGPVFLVGDAVYTLRNLREDILPWRTHDDDASRESMRRLRTFAAAHPGVALIPTHDAEAWEVL